jgi:hypothetical protein
MTRRKAFSTKLDRWQAARSTSADHLLLLASGTAGVAVDGRRFDLSAHDALRINAPAGVSLSLDAPVIAAELFRQFVQ